MDLSIIIVNYKDKKKLINCLNSIKRIEFSQLSYEVIVVDNNSGDNLNDFGYSYHFIKVINSDKNLGMGGGNNLGLANSSGEYILVLNPDTIINKEAIKILIQYLKDNPGVGIVGPKLLYPDGSLQYSCSRFPQVYMPILRRTFIGHYFRTLEKQFTMNDFDHKSIKEVDWLMGSCLMFKREIVLDDKIIKLRFDSRYFMYFEDIDLCRQSWFNNLKVVYNPEASIVHDHARESAKYSWYLAIFLDKLAREHIVSWIKYFIKWGVKFKK